MPRGRLARIGLEVALVLLVMGCSSVAHYRLSLDESTDPLSPPSPFFLATETPAFGLPTAIPSPTPTEPPTVRPSPTPLPTATPPVPLAELRKTPQPSTTVLGHGLRLPPGFKVGLYAKDLETASNMVYSPDGVLFVSLPGKGVVMALHDAYGKGEADRQSAFAGGLVRPTGLAFREGYLYVAEAHQVVRFFVEPGRLTAPGNPEVVVPALPVGGNETAHAIGFGPDGKLYVSVPASCNACREADYRRATVMRYNLDGSGEEIFAQGLRDVEAFVWYPSSLQMLATNCSRSRMSDDLPPDTLEMLVAGANYGWPFCHAGDIPDPQLGWPDSCEGVPPPLMQLPAQTAPKSLLVYTGSQFPEDYRGDIFVALYGSWERTVPVGYRIVRINVENGQLAGSEDLVSGWLFNEQAWGHPAGLVQAPDGSLLISDDRVGAVYRVYYEGG